MLEGRKIAVIMPAYNAAETLAKTVKELPDIVDDIIVVDDCSRDGTRQEAQKLKVFYHRHRKNKGYGGNQKTCYRLALKRGAGIVVMVHPDYQYSPRLVTAMVAMLASGHYDIILASRILGDQNARAGKMPIWRYAANRFLTLTQNLLLKQKLSEFHTGYRAYTSEVLKSLPLHLGSDDFVFDNELLAQASYAKFRIGEISCPTRYDPSSSSINFGRSVRYGLGVLRVSLMYRLDKMGFIDYYLFNGSSFSSRNTNLSLSE